MSIYSTFATVWLVAVYARRFGGLGGVGEVRAD